MPTPSSKQSNRSSRAPSKSRQPHRHSSSRTPPLPPAKYGFSPAKWLAAKDEARTAMIARCKLQSTITYTELAESIHSIKLSADDHRLRFLLEEISTDEDKVGRGLISAIVVHCGGSRMPGNGFFDLAARRARDTTDHTTCWINELNFVHQQWLK